MKNDSSLLYGGIFGTRVATALAVMLLVSALAMGDLMEIMPVFSGAVASTIFPYFHEVHDILAVGAVLFAAYKYSPSLGVAAIFLFLAAHIPYVIVEFSGHGPEFMRILAIAFIAFFGLTLVSLLRKEERKVRKEIEEWQATFDAVSDPISIHDINFKVVNVNKAFTQTIKRGREEIIGQFCYQLMHRTDEPCLTCPFVKAISSGEVAAEEFFEQNLGMYVRMSASPLFDESGNITGCVHIITDITERKRMEDRLLFLASFPELNPNPLLEMDSEGNISYLNPTAKRLFPDLVILGVNHPFLAAWADVMKEVQSNSSPDPIVREVAVGVNHFEQVIQQINSPIYGNRIRLYCRDVTRSNQAEQALRDSEERYRALVQLGADVGEAVVVLQDTDDGEGIQTFVSDPWLKITGYSRAELLGKSFFQIVAPQHRVASRERHRKKIAGQVMSGLFEISVICKDGREVPVEVTSAYSSYNGKPANVAYIRDISERKRFEERLMMNDRMTSIGQLASGIAHELNNPLTGVIGFSELLMDRVGEVPEHIREDLTTINREAKRAAGIIRGLLTFARGQKAGKELVDIDKSLGEVLQLRAYEHRVNNIEVKTNLAENLPAVMVNRGQLQQVFINMIINAEHAMLLEHKKGVLTVTTEQVGDAVRISFEDDGPGISPDHMRLLFTPFFTTKEVGKGTGLGLSICHGIITEHGGRIWAESEFGKGASFIIELPAAQNKE